jgi:Ca2+-binding EF-hand superfamily protein
VYRMFELADTDGGNSLCAEEVRVLLSLMGLELSDEALREAMAEMDTSGSTADIHVTNTELYDWW